MIDQILQDILAYVNNWIISTNLIILTVCLILIVTRLLVYLAVQIHKLSNKDMRLTISILTSIPLFIFVTITANQQYKYRQTNKYLETIDSDDIPASYNISYDPSFFYKQWKNECWPYSVSAVQRIINNEQVDSKYVNTIVPYRLIKWTTLPEWLEKYLHTQWISTVRLDLDAISQEQKVQYLKHQISNNNPIIILWDTDLYQHYFTIIGYDTINNEWYIYDSLQKEWDNWLTIDSNWDQPWNLTMTNDQFFKFRSGWWKFGLYSYYALVSVNK